MKLRTVNRLNIINYAGKKLCVRTQKKKNSYLLMSDDIGVCRQRTYNSALSLVEPAARNANCGYNSAVSVCVCRR